MARRESAGLRIAVAVKKEVSGVTFTVYAQQRLGESAQQLPQSGWYTLNE